MNRIEQRVALTNAGQAQGVRSAGNGAAFTLPVIRSGAEKTAGTTRMAPVSYAGPLDTLVALQANDQAADRKRRQAKRGRDLLDGLDRLKGALLSGRVAPGDLDRLRGQLAARREDTDDPRLDEVLGHIELRAAVELAKLGRTA